MIKLKQINLDDLNKLSIQVYRKKKFLDSRGWLSLDYEGELIGDFSNISIKTSKSKNGIGRGLHLQKKSAPQTKIISVLQGSIIDFVYDPFDKDGCVYCFELTSADLTSIVIPPNFAHGFITTSDTIFNYICLGKYDESCEITYNLLGSAARLLELNKVVLSEKDSSYCEIDMEFF